MTSAKRLRFEAYIEAPPSRVYELIIGPESYRDWTSAFVEGSYFKGSWSQGQGIRFLAPSGDGMMAEIAENRPNEFISIRHIGFIKNGVEDTGSPAVRAGAPAFENYTLEAAGRGTRLIVDEDVSGEFESYMNEAWPRALARLKALAESRDAT